MEKILEIDDKNLTRVSSSGDTKFLNVSKAGCKYYFIVTTSHAVGPLYDIYGTDSEGEKVAFVPKELDSLKYKYIWPNSNDSLVSINKLLYDRWYDNVVDFSNIPGITNITDTSEMFGGNVGLEEIKMFNTSTVTNMEKMFFGCTQITKLDVFDTGSVTNMNSMFTGCSHLEYIPEFNTANVTDMYSFASNCTRLKKFPMINTSKVTNMSGMLYSCKALETIPMIDTSSVTNMNAMFRSCTSLKTVPELNCNNVVEMSNTFDACSSLISIRMVNIGCSLDISRTALNKDAVVYLFNNLKSVAGQTIKLNSSLDGSFSEGELAIATNKGWTVSYR